MKSVTLTDVTIQKLFGHEAAEDEDIRRLREYYFKGKVYDSVASDVSLRILVGHKGTGKSALFSVARAEDTERSQLPILIRPDDVADLGADSTTFLRNVRNWKDGLQEIIGRKALTSFGLGESNWQSQFSKYGSKVGAFLADTLKPYSDRNISLDPAKNALLAAFLKNHAINVYVDDLDRGWQGRREDIQSISALLNAVRDISNENHEIRFKVALRSDVYYLVRTSDESTDKIEGAVVWHTWSNHEILLLLIKRIETFLGKKFDEHELLATEQRHLAYRLDPFFEPRFQGLGHWENAPTYRVMMSLIRQRPRDLVKLCTLAAKHAHARDSDIICTADLQSVFEEYSQGRIQDTINEFRSELPDLERLVMGMKPKARGRTTQDSYVYGTDELLKKIKSIQERGRFLLTNGREATPQDLAQFLYKINFLTARKEREDGEIVRKYFEENRYLSSQFADFGFLWEVHPAYRWALQPDNIRDIFRELKLSADGV